ncbi:MAG: NfeD family protein [Chromatiaceae bacterium]|nr:NfeD family protein [Gammaproteobacteria bacterium]MCP5305355.1 NfeD family protein [Chromatiaceae bacterium]MCP5315314.1 NfeD family protein [Chromatiaceae bacterium]
MIAGYQPDFWHWWILALVLIIAETLLPGTFFLWMGISALLLGVLAWLVPVMGWELQLMLFAILSLVSIVGWRFWQRRHPDESEQPNLNRRGEQYLGRVLVLEKPIENGFGKVRVDDTLWRVRGADAAAGSRVRVTGVEGVVLTVEVE